MIRILSTKDVPNLVDLGAEFWDESYMASFGPYNHEHIYRQLFNGLNKNLIGYGFFVDNTLISAIILQIVCNFWNNEKQLSEIAWFSKKNYRNGFSNIKLLKTAENYAKQHNIKYITMGRIKGPPSYEKLDKVYKKLNYNEIETTYVRNIESP